MEQLANHVMSEALNSYFAVNRKIAFLESELKSANEDQKNYISYWLDTYSEAQLNLIEDFMAWDYENYVDFIESNGHLFDEVKEGEFDFHIENLASFQSFELGMTVKENKSNKVYEVVNKYKEYDFIDDVEYNVIVLKGENNKKTGIAENIVLRDFTIMN
ncbi:hypothetical protein BAOM_3076 [Peribacillus asahii]|uniref:Uncharacterized protein n=1 Tax=Peribacillus asahii TaxID=228899 RepID=A0A3T0KTW2_9BACI|nr:hypothetical protein [Peribacillus asahii]AZV43685.1 hypothetical protein BAOM_3076 [Peribacillus asahii]